MSLDKNVQYQFTVLNNELDEAYRAVAHMGGTVTGSSMKTLAADILSIKQVPDAPAAEGEYFLTCDVTQSGSVMDWTVLPAVAKTGQYSDLLDKPTKLSQFENDPQYVTSLEAEQLLAAKQDKITVSARLGADLVDDSSSANKFVTAADISGWDSKQDPVIAGSNITIDADGRTINASQLSVSSSSEAFRGNELTIKSHSGSVYVFSYITDIYIPGATAEERSSALLQVGLSRNGLLMQPGDFSYAITGAGKLSVEFSAGKDLTAESADEYLASVLIAIAD